MKQEPRYYPVFLVALAPVTVGLFVSFVYSFRCCEGLAFWPVPLLGYLRWDVSAMIWTMLGLAALLVSFLVSLVGKYVLPDGHRSTGLSMAMVVALYALFLHQNVRDYCGRELVHRFLEYGGRAPARFQLPLAPTRYGKADLTEWAQSHCIEPDEQVMAALDQQGLPRNNRSTTPIFTPAQCDEIIALAWSHAHEWMSVYWRRAPYPHIIFPGDTNMENSHSTDYFKEKDALFPSWLSPSWMPRWNFKYGFEPYVTRPAESSLLNMTHAHYLRSVYQKSFRLYLEMLRTGLARYWGVDPPQIVLGGDAGTVLSDFSPPSLTVYPPQRIGQHFMNPHPDIIQWAMDKIQKRLRMESNGKEPCHGEFKLYGGTLAVELPKDDASGLLWWQYQNHEDKEETCYRTRYKLGHLATIPGGVMHSVAPWKYNGWIDRPRTTMQMFMFQCVHHDDPSKSTWYVFN